MKTTVTFSEEEINVVQPFGEVAGKKKNILKPEYYGYSFLNIEVIAGMYPDNFTNQRGLFAYCKLQTIFRLQVFPGIQITVFSERDMCKTIGAYVSIGFINRKYSSDHDFHKMLHNGNAITRRIEA